MDSSSGVEQMKDEKMDSNGNSEEGMMVKEMNFGKTNEAISWIPCSWYFDIFVFRQMCATSSGEIENEQRIQVRNWSCSSLKIVNILDAMN